MNIIWMVWYAQYSIYKLCATTSICRDRYPDKQQIIQPAFS